MIEQIVLNFLMERLPDPVHMEFPANPTGRFYVLRKADTGREDLLDSAMFTVRSYAASLLEAAQMNELAKTAMDALVELDAVSASDRGGDYAFMDTQNMRPCYQMVQNIIHY